MQRYYRIEFTATLQKMSLAFKMECEVQVFWKRGEKVASTGRVPFRNCIASFNKDLTISCNMVFDNRNKFFKEKQTKFAIVIYTQKGNKQAGQILFDVAPFLNERSQSKSYEMGLSKCPDKNAKLYFTLKANIIEEKSYDTLSESSIVSVDIQTLADKSSQQNNQNSPMKMSSNKPKIQVQSIPQPDMKSVTSIMSKKKQKVAEIIPTTDRQYESNHNQTNLKPNTDRRDPMQNSAEAIKNLQNQNKKIREQLKRKQQLKKENEQLKRRLKDDDYESCKQFKQKIEQGKKEIQQMNQQSKGAKKANQEIKRLQKEILRCKERIMKIFNEAEKFGPEEMDKIQEACGIRQY